MEQNIQNTLKRIIELEKELLDLKKNIAYNLKQDETIEMKKVRNNRYSDFMRIEDK